MDRNRTNNPTGVNHFRPFAQALDLYSTTLIANAQVPGLEADMPTALANAYYQVEITAERLLLAAIEAYAAMVARERVTAFLESSDTPTVLAADAVSTP